MRYPTHILFCVLISLLAFNVLAIQDKILFILIAVIFTLLPDIDESSSKLGRKVRPLSFFLKHRGFFHSIWLPLLLVLILYNISFEISIAIFIGYSSHLILDSLTKTGIAFLYPLKWRIKGFAKTGGLFEKLVFIALLISIIFIII